MLDSVSCYKRATALRPCFCSGLRNSFAIDERDCDFVCTKLPRLEMKAGSPGLAAKWKLGAPRAGFARGGSDFSCTGWPMALAKCVEITSGGPSFADFAKGGSALRFEP